MIEDDLAITIQHSRDASENSGVDLVGTKVSTKIISSDTYVAIEKTIACSDGEAVGRGGGESEVCARGVGGGVDGEEELWGLGEELAFGDEDLYLWCDDEFCVKGVS